MKRTELRNNTIKTLPSIYSMQKKRSFYLVALNKIHNHLEKKIKINLKKGGSKK